MDRIDAIRWLFAVMLGLFGLLVVVSTYGGLISTMRSGRNYSMVPLIGGGSLSFAWLLCPGIGAKNWAWIPLLIDPGCALLFASVAVYGAVRLIRGRHDDGTGALDNNARRGDDNNTSQEARSDS